MNLRHLFIYGLCVLALSGCGRKESPKVENTAVQKNPQLVTSAPRTMDMIAAQNNPAAMLAQTAENAVFFTKLHPSTEPQKERSGAKFDHQIELNGKVLTLRGVAVRKFEMSAISLMTIYTVALYVPADADISGPIPDTERVLILEYHLDVPKEKVVQAIRDSVYANPDVNADEVEPDFEKLSDAFDSPHKGDRYIFPYIPGRGTAMIKEKENRMMIVIPGLAFAKAFYDIWLSPHGNDAQMRCELMDLPCPEKSMLNPVNAVSSGLGEAKEKLGKLKSLIPGQ